MEAIKEIYKCPLCSHGTLDPENHSCHKQFVLQLNNLKDNKPVLLEWEEYKYAQNHRAELTYCLECGGLKNNDNDKFCSRYCYSVYRKARCSDGDK